MTGAAGTTTFLLTDIEGSTRNWEASEAEMRQALGRHDALLSRIIDEDGPTSRRETGHPRLPCVRGVRSRRVPGRRRGLEQRVGWGRAWAGPVVGSGGRGPGHNLRHPLTE
jgi:class 3 adenylate cyclase